MLAQALDVCGEIGTGAIVVLPVGVYLAADFFATLVAVLELDHAVGGLAELGQLLADVFATRHKIGDDVHKAHAVFGQRVHHLILIGP